MPKRCSRISGNRRISGACHWDEWQHTVAEDEAAATWDYIAHSPRGSIAKARHRLGYAPRYPSLDAVIESIGALIATGMVRVP